VKILFVMRHPMFVRYFESVIDKLAERGHRIHLGFTPAAGLDGVKNSQVDRLIARHPGVTASIVPERADHWSFFATYVRSLRSYLRYLDPVYSRCHGLAQRAREQIDPVVPWLIRNTPGLRRPAAAAAMARILKWIESVVPTDPIVDAEIQRHRPALVLVSPLIDPRSKQVDYVKSAAALGVRTGLCVASWDNLTNKGLIQPEPDAVLVWNEDQRREAIEMHGVDPAGVHVTGAHTFDEWFERRPSSTRDAFCRRVGLPADRPFILYLCSSKWIAREETEFVARWLETLRRQEGALGDVGVLVRPHPQNAEQWRGVDLSSFGPVAVWPRGGEFCFDEDAKTGYFDSLYHSAAVFGINTSGLIEAGILGRVGHTLLAPEFADTQEGTLHFDYLIQTGFLRSARDFAEHFAQLSQTLHRPQEAEALVRRFIGSFIRPLGVDRRCTDACVDCIENLQASATPVKSTPAWTARAARPLFFLAAAAAHLVHRGYRAWRRRGRVSTPAVVPAPAFPAAGSDSVQPTRKSA
jgi:hypothetical protein